MPHKDPFAVLEISRGASEDEIKKAFREKAKRFHPDLARTNTNPWLHYRDYGRKEGRHSALVRKA